MLKPEGAFRSKPCFDLSAVVCPMRGYARNILGLNFPYGLGTGSRADCSRTRSMSHIVAPVSAVATGRALTFKSWDLRFEALPDEITACHSSLGAISWGQTWPLG
jgi:hypothetical protein